LSLVDHWHSQAKNVATVAIPAPRRAIVGARKLTVHKLVRVAKMWVRG
jgi:hypothetical protein